uniref:Modification methylase HemK family-like protein n=1 Tax=Adineta vaga TaxID=104782 RepID=B3G454_ADIVA|nr:modification methylase HemK family-like protein [Adineta vaga]
MSPTMNDDVLLQLAQAIKQTDYHFITVTPATHARVNRRAENRWARTLNDVFGWSRPFHSDLFVDNKDLFDLMHRAQILVEIKDNNEENWRSSIRISSLDNELFLHSAYPTSAADSVFFGPDTYRFSRAIRAVIDARPSTAPAVRRVVDIGCGAGPGAIMLAKTYPNAEILGVDINDTALRLTSINARLANVNVVACHSDLLKDVQGDFDMIISNPPYLVDSSMRRYRHGGGSLGAELSVAIVNSACQRLANGGTLLLYTGSAIMNGQDLFYEEVKNKLDNSGLCWTYEEVDPDVFGEELETETYVHADRIAAVVLIATKNSA